MEKIKERIIFNLDKYNFKIYKESREQWVNRRAEYNYILFNSDIPFMDIVKSVREKFNYRPCIEQSERDFMQTFFKIVMLNNGFKLEDIKKRYKDPYEEVEERMMFRFELYKDGWDIEQIEKYISRYLKKDEYTPLDLEYYEMIYYNMMILLEIYKKEKKNKIGRPSLPLSLKRYIKGKHIDKTREEMRKKYEYATKYEKIKDKLLTSEDLVKIESQINDKELLEKLRFLAIE